MNQKVETIDINLSSQEIEQRLLSNKKEFESKKISQLEFKFISNRSVGTLQTKGFLVNSVSAINIDGKLKKIDDNLTQITLSTRPRVKLKFVIIAYFAIVLLALLGKYFYDEKAPIILIFLVPLVPFWFRFIYFEQEKVLMQNVIKYLKLLERL